MNITFPSKLIKIHKTRRNTSFKWAYHEWEFMHNTLISSSPLIMAITHWSRCVCDQYWLAKISPLVLNPPRLNFLAVFATHTYSLRLTDVFSSWTATTSSFPYSGDFNFERKNEKSAGNRLVCAFCSKQFPLFELIDLFIHYHKSHFVSSSFLPFYTNWMHVILVVTFDLMLWVKDNEFWKLN